MRGDNIHNQGWECHKLPRLQRVSREKRPHMHQMQWEQRAQTQTQIDQHGVPLGLDSMSILDHVFHLSDCHACDISISSMLRRF